METRLLATADGDCLSYFVKGRGRPVLLVHGFTMWSDMWKANGVVDELSGNARIIAPDLRGHGSSDRPHYPSEYGFKLTSDLVAIIEADAISCMTSMGAC
jgi:pimeloyl-ACP methyl ester carboxylesterase